MYPIFGSLFPLEPVDGVHELVFGDDFDMVWESRTFLSRSRHADSGLLVFDIHMATMSSAAVEDLFGALTQCKNIESSTFVNIILFLMLHCNHYH